MPRAALWLTISRGGVTAEFFTDLRGLCRPPIAPLAGETPRPIGQLGVDAREFERFKMLFQGLVGLLGDKGVVMSGELRVAVEAEALGEDLP